MQGSGRADRQLLDAAALAGHLVPAGSMFAFLAAHRAEVFPDADYADLFAPPGRGRPSLPANDPDARHTRKSPEARRDGYRAHVAADPETGIITDEKLTGAAGTGNSDAAIAAEFVAAEGTAGSGDGLGLL